MQRRQVIGSFGRLLGLSGASALAGWSLPAWSQVPGVTDTRIVVGQSAPFSGAGEQSGVQYFMGANLYFQSLNDKGGVNGRRIEIQKLDDAQSPERCVENTRKFIDQGVFALFGYVGTDTTLAAMPVATSARVPLFAPMSGAAELREPVNRNVIHLRASFAEEAEAQIKHAALLGIQRIAIFYQDDGHGRSSLNGLTTAMTELKLKPVASVAADKAAPDVSKAVGEVVASKPQAIMLIGNYKTCASFIRQARQKGFSGSFYTMSTVGTQALKDELGAVAKGVAISQVMPYPYSTATALSREYINAHKDLRGITPNYVGMEGFVAAKTFAEAVKRAGRNLSTEAFQAAIDSMTNVDLGGFRMEFGSNRRVGSHFVEVTILTEDGRVLR